MVLTARAALAAAIGAVIVVAIPAGGWTMLAVVGALVVLVTIDVVGAAAPTRLEIGRELAAACRLGESTPATLTIRNSGPRPARLTVRDAWPPSATAVPRSHRLDLSAGRAGRVVTTLRPARRGELRVEVAAVRSTGPLGLAGRQSNLPVGGGLRVLPAFASRRFLPEKLSRLRDLEGAVAAPQRGHGTEFDTLREYVVGDDTRSIDWRATARRADVVVRTWRPERDRQIVLVLDTGRTAAARVAGVPRLDATLDAVLLFTAVASRAGDRVTVIAHDRTLRAAVEVNRADALPAVVNATGGLTPVLAETDMHAIAGQVLRRARKRALVVVFTAVEAGSARDGIVPQLTALAARHLVCVAAVTDPEADELRAGRGTPSSVYAAAAAEAAATERRSVISLLQRRGIQVVEATPDVFASHVTDAYLNLKAAGRL